MIIQSRWSSGYILFGFRVWVLPSDCSVFIWDGLEKALCLHHLITVPVSLVLFFQPLLGTCLFFLRTTDKAITTANVQQVSNTDDVFSKMANIYLCDTFVLSYLLCLQEVNFGMLDCSDGSILNSLETLLARIMLPALRSQQVHTTIRSAGPLLTVTANYSSKKHWKDLICFLIRGPVKILDLSELSRNQEQLSFLSFNLSHG